MADAWDKFVDGTRDVVHSLADAAETLFEKGKGYVNTQRLEAKLRDDYRLLGKLQYQKEAGTDCDEGQREKVIAEIGVLIAELNKAEAGRKYEFISCGNCDALIPADAAYCPRCGVKVGSADSAGD